MIDLRQGRWQDMLADVESVDAVICDPPYSPRTHAGYRAGAATAGVVASQLGIVQYKPITEDLIREFASHWVPRVRQWIVVFGDDVSAQWWKRALADAGLYVFAPLPWIKRSAPPRFTGDGPQSSVEWITTASTEPPDHAIDQVVVARQRSAKKRGSLRGWYMVSRVEGDHNGSQMPGQKNLAGMRAIIRDYTDADDLIVDPFAGIGTTLEAARIEGRRAIGSECDPKTFAKARRRLDAGYTPDLFAAGG